MRRYDDPVQVQTSDDADGTDGGLVPHARPHRFLWRGRVYDIDAVHDQWVIRQPWWRRALASDGGAWALAPDLLDEYVWRVSAVARGVAPSQAGIYDLACGRQWRLLRVGD